MTRLTAGLTALALAAGLAAGAVGGIYADQAFPDQVPLIGARHASQSLDERTLERALQVVRNDYYGGGDLDYARLSHGSVRGLVGGLDDRFSYYLDPDQYQRQLNSYNGRYVGIGVELEYPPGGYPRIDTVFAGSPAEKAGLVAGDVVTAVNGSDLKGLGSDQVGALIRGPAGSRVKVTVDRGGAPYSVEVERQQISIPSVRSARLDKVFYIRIYSFGTDTPTDFAAQLKAGAAGASGVILDLRDDGGGFIEAAAQAIGEFVTSGEAFRLRDRRNNVEVKPVGSQHEYPAGPVIVLVNANTASAAEMVSGSLKVHSRARLVGVKTYGKGSVQQDYPLPDGSDLHLTIKKWFLPDGSSVDGTGLQPDVSVAEPPGAALFDAAHPERGHAADAQLNQALALLGQPTG